MSRRLCKQDVVTRATLMAHHGEMRLMLGKGAVLVMYSCPRSVLGVRCCIDLGPKVYKSSATYGHLRVQDTYGRAQQPV